MVLISLIFRVSSKEKNHEFPSYSTSPLLLMGRLEISPDGPRVDSMQKSIFLILDARFAKFIVDMADLRFVCWISCQRLDCSDVNYLLPQMMSVTLASTALWRIGQDYTRNDRQLSSGK
jgi:hypothetical protein